MCAKVCFPKKAQHFPNVYPARLDNYLASQQPDFVDRMVDVIQKSGVEIISPQHSGDFYDQLYLDAWGEILRRLPERGLFVYTKSLDLDLTPLTRLRNATVIKSFGGKFDQLIDESKDDYAKVVTKIDPKTVKSGEFVCPAIRLGNDESEKFCGNLCHYCTGFDPKTGRRHGVRVVFLEKTAGRNGSSFIPKNAPPPSPRPQVTPTLSGGTTV